MISKPTLKLCANLIKAVIFVVPIILLAQIRTKLNKTDSFPSQQNSVILQKSHQLYCFNHSHITGITQKNASRK